jgi:chemotaxis protein histidine kinase CheA
MATLDRITEMQQQNKSEAEITTQLQNEGIPPAEINDALSQAKIKQAVSPPEQPAQEMPGAPPPQGMQASMMPGEPGQAAAQPPVPSPPQPQPQQQEQEYAAPAPPQQEEDYYQPTPQAYSEQDYYAPQGSMDTETISEIAEQVATEKLENYKTKVGDMVSFKNQIQDKVDDIDDRLKRIENSIQQLQQAVIGKMAEFGESSAMIHKDLDNLHGTVSKLMDPLVDNVKEMKKLSK